MPRTVFGPGTIVTSQFLNAIQNIQFIEPRLDPVTNTPRSLLDLEDGKYFRLGPENLELSLFNNTFVTIEAVNQTIGGQKTFAVPPAVASMPASPNMDALVTRGWVEANALLKNQPQTIAHQFIFNSVPQSPNNPINASDLVNLGYFLANTVRLTGDQSVAGQKVFDDARTTRASDWVPQHLASVGYVQSEALLKNASTSQTVNGPVVFSEVLISNTPDNNPNRPVTFGTLGGYTTQQELTDTLALQELSLYDCYVIAQAVRNLQTANKASQVQNVAAEARKVSRNIHYPITKVQTFFAHFERHSSGYFSFGVTPVSSVWNPLIPLAMARAGRNATEQEIKDALTELRPTLNLPANIDMNHPNTVKLRSIFGSEAGLEAITAQVLGIGLEPAHVYGYTKAYNFIGQSNVTPQALNDAARAFLRRYDAKLTTSSAQRFLEAFRPFVPNSGTPYIPYGVVNNNTTTLAGRWRNEQFVDALMALGGFETAEDYEDWIELNFSGPPIEIDDSHPNNQLARAIFEFYGVPARKPLTSVISGLLGYSLREIFAILDFYHRATPAQRANKQSFTTALTSWAQQHRMSIRTAFENVVDILSLFEDAESINRNYIFFGATATSGVPLRYLNMFMFDAVFNLRAGATPQQLERELLRLCNFYGYSPTGLSIDFQNDNLELLRELRYLKGRDSSDITAHPYYVGILMEALPNLQSQLSYTNSTTQTLKQQIDVWLPINFQAIHNEVNRLIHENYSSIIKPISENELEAILSTIDWYPGNNWVGTGFNEPNPSLFKRFATSYYSIAYGIGASNINNNAASLVDPTCPLFRNTFAEVDHSTLPFLFGEGDFGYIGALILRVFQAVLPVTTVNGQRVMQIPTNSLTGLLNNTLNHGFVHGRKNIASVDALKVFFEGLCILQGDYFYIDMLYNRVLNFGAYNKVPMTPLVIHDVTIINELVARFCISSDLTVTANSQLYAMPRNVWVDAIGALPGVSNVDSNNYLFRFIELLRKTEISITTRETLSAEAYVALSLYSTFNTANLAPSQILNFLETQMYSLVLTFDVNINSITVNEIEQWAAFTNSLTSTGEVDRNAFCKSQNNLFPVPSSVNMGVTSFYNDPYYGYCEYISSYLYAYLWAKGSSFRRKQIENDPVLAFFRHAMLAENRYQMSRHLLDSVYSVQKGCMPNTFYSLLYSADLVLLISAATFLPNWRTATWSEYQNIFLTKLGRVPFSQYIFNIFNDYSQRENWAYGFEMQYFTGTFPIYDNITTLEPFTPFAKQIQWAIRLESRISVSYRNLVTVSTLADLSAPPWNTNWFRGGSDKFPLICTADTNKLYRRNTYGNYVEVSP